MQPPLDADAIEDRLELLLLASLSSRRTASEPARRLATRNRGEQERILEWVGVMARLNPELGFQFSNHAPEALRWMDLAGVGAWFEAVMARYDAAGLQGAFELLKGAEAFSADCQSDVSGVALTDLRGVLEKFVVGLGGRALGLEPGERPGTDTETLFLPARMNHFSAGAANRRLFFAAAALLWAQSRFGTYYPGLAGRLEAFADSGRAAAIYNALEALRLERVLIVTNPGLGRFAAALSQERTFSASWRAAGQALEGLADPLDVGLGRERVWGLLEALFAAGESAPEPAPHHGVLLPEHAEAVMTARINRERTLFRRAVGQMTRDPQAPLTLELTDPAPNLSIQIMPDGFTFDMRLDGRPLEPPEAFGKLLGSVVQDLGWIPPEYLVPAGPGGYRPDQEGGGGDLGEVGPEEGPLRYDEWDHQRQGYRRNWCILREHDLHEGDADFTARTLAKHGGLVHGIRRTFEMLRGGDRLLKRQERGDEVDIDAVVDAIAEARNGREMSDRLYQRMARDDRNVAALILVDLSGSTKGWVNDAIRESLVLLTEGLGILGDRFAIYGFSSQTRLQCDFFRIKTFDEPLSDVVRNRIAGIKPLDYTRMGVFIRHGVQILEQAAAGVRLMIHLSDGKPEDYDSFRHGYRGRYGLEDTRQALFEARRAGIHPFCITIDREARDYLPHLYGPARFTVLDSAAALPIKISDIYRKLTV